jgi:hypothetical protein
MIFRRDRVEVEIIQVGNGEGRSSNLSYLKEKQDQAQ